jgi:hypothetical protein
MNYPGLSTSGQTEFIVRENGQFSLACESQTSFNGNQYNNLVQETRNGVTKTLTSSNSGSGFNLPLYTGYDSAKVANAVPVACVRMRPIIPAGAAVRTEGHTLIITGPGNMHGQAAAISVFSATGSRMTTRAIQTAGNASVVVAGLARGIYMVRTNCGRTNANRVMVP